MYHINILQQFFNKLLTGLNLNTKQGTETMSLFTSGIGNMILHSIFYYPDML